MIKDYKELSIALCGTDKLVGYLESIAEDLQKPKDFNEAIMFLYNTQLSIEPFVYINTVRKEYYDNKERETKSICESYMASYDWIERSDK